MIFFILLFLSFLIQALLFKSRELGTLTPDQYRRWVTKISYYGWRKQEPLEFEISEKLIPLKVQFSNIKVLFIVLFKFSSPKKVQL